jgi:hypothetical protein
VEDGITNVCGLAPEDLLAHYDFKSTNSPQGSRFLAGRLAPLTRVTKWFLTGPLAYGNHGLIPSDVYRAGDTFAFLDPFLGSGLVNAVATGRSAGVAAVRGLPPASTRRNATDCCVGLFTWLGFFRTALERGLAEKFGWLMAAGLLFRATRLTTSGPVRRRRPT